MRYITIRNLCVLQLNAKLERQIMTTENGNYSETTTTTTTEIENLTPEQCHTMRAAALHDLDVYLASVAGNTISSAGFTQLRRYARGERLTARQAILADCCDCTGHYADGKRDCMNFACVKYPFMPYRYDKKRIVRKSKKEQQ